MYFFHCLLALLESAQGLPSHGAWSFCSKSRIPWHHAGSSKSLAGLTCSRFSKILPWGQSLAMSCYINCLSISRYPLFKCEEKLVFEGFSKLAEIGKCHEDVLLLKKKNISQVRHEGWAQICPNFYYGNARIFCPPSLANKYRQTARFPKKCWNLGVRGFSFVAAQIQWAFLFMDILYWSFDNRGHTQGFTSTYSCIGIKCMKPQKQLIIYSTPLKSWCHEV